MKETKTPSPHTKSLIRSFTICAPMSATIPQCPLPPEEAPGILRQEIARQCQHALIELLYKHYGLHKDRVWRKLYVVDSGSIDTDERIFSIQLARGKIKGKNLRQIGSGIEKFENDFITAAACVPDVQLLEPKKPEVFAFSYRDTGLFTATDYMLTTHHPENKQALAHLHAAVHVMERLYTELPANRLI